MSNQDDATTVLYRPIFVKTRELRHNPGLPSQGIFFGPWLTLM
jgi:hypothetical protein